MGSSAITGGKIPGTIFENRAGWRINTNDFDTAFDDLCDAVLARIAYATTRAGILYGFVPLAGVSANTVSVSGGGALDFHGQLINKTTNTNVTVGVGDVGKYICLYYAESTSGARESIVMGTVANMYSDAAPYFSLVSNPTVATIFTDGPVRVCYVSAVDGGGNVTISTVLSSSYRDEWQHYHAWRSIKPDSVKSQYYGGFENDMLTVPYPTQLNTLNDDLNYIKSVFSEWITGGSRYPGAWDDVNAAAGSPGTPTGLAATSGNMSDLRYNGSI